MLKYVYYSFHCVYYINYLSQTPCDLSGLGRSFHFACVFSLSVFMCVRVFVVQQIPDSNLLMLVVQADCDCSRQYPPITMEPKEVKYILSHYVILDSAGMSSTPAFCPIKTGDNLFQKSQWVCSRHCSSLTPSHIMLRLNVTG